MRVLFFTVAASLFATGAEAQLRCVFPTTCPSGQACAESDFDLTVTKAGGGSSSRVVINGAMQAWGAFELSTIGEAVQANVQGREGGGSVLLVNHAGLTHLLTLGSEGREAAYAVMSPEARTVTSYFGTCEGRW